MKPDFDFFEILAQPLMDKICRRYECDLTTAELAAALAFAYNLGAEHEREACAKMIVYEWGAAEAALANEAAALILARSAK